MISTILFTFKNPSPYNLSILDTQYLYTFLLTALSRLLLGVSGNLILNMGRSVRFYLLALCIVCKLMYFSLICAAVD